MRSQIATAKEESRGLGRGDGHLSFDDIRIGLGIGREKPSITLNMQIPENSRV
jgi:hypothetical protein